MNTKQIFGMGALALSLTGSAFAAPLDPSLNLIFSTDGSTQTTAVDNTGTVASRGLGIGYSAANDFAKGDFVNSTTPQTAQSVYNPLIAGTSAAGAFTTISAGSNFQLALHGYANNQTNPTQPVTIFASLFNYDPTAGANQVPVTGPAIFTVPVTIAATPGLSSDTISFSDTIQLANPIVAGNEYVLAVSPGAAGGTNPANYATVDRANFNLSGIPAADAAFDKQYFLVDNNSDSTGSQFISHQIGGLTQGLGYRFYASAASNPVPETSSMISFGALLGLGGLFLVRRRRAN